MAQLKEFENMSTTLKRDKNSPQKFCKSERFRWNYYQSLQELIVALDVET